MIYNNIIWLWGKRQYLLNTAYISAPPANESLYRLIYGQTLAKSMAVWYKVIKEVEFYTLMVFVVHIS